MTHILCEVERKVAAGERLNREDGLALLESQDLALMGYLADQVRKRVSGQYVYFNVNRHINLTNVCTAQCRFCAFGCEEHQPQAYAMTKETAVRLAVEAAQDPDLRELHIVSGLHPNWPFDYYVDVIAAIRKALPDIHLKAFTAVELWHFAKISDLSVKQVLETLQQAGLNSLPGGGAEILSERVRQELCPNKASAAEWLSVTRTAHEMGIRSNATMLYGHIETPAERIEHLIKLRDLQDATGGFQTFIGLPFHPLNTKLQESVRRVSAWEDLKMVAIARLMLDNFPNIKAYWVMLSLPIAQLALGFGANDVDGTVSEERITHAAGAKTGRSLPKEALIEAIYQAGRVPAERDSLYNLVKIYHAR